MPSGTRYSPIPIDDDSEEEVAVELCTIQDGNTPTMPLQHSFNWKDNSHPASPPFMTTSEFAVSDRNSNSLKRKIFDDAGQVGQSTGPLFESKNARRKKRRRGRRIIDVVERLEQALPYDPPPLPLPLPPRLVLPPPSNQAPQSVTHSVHAAIPPLPQHSNHHLAHLPPKPFSEPTPYYSHATHNYSAYAPTPTRTDWMTYPPDDTPRPLDFSQENFKQPSILPPLSVSLAPYGSYATPPIREKPLSLPLPPKPAAPPQPIGMKAEADPGQIHGRFNVPPSPVVWCKSARSQQEGQHLLDASCALVLEQLPKTHRTIAFVRSWASKASGSEPAYISIDTSKAKALVEFLNITLAQTAWGSPRLGGEMVSLKSTQLKGRPREDLIRAWWYRPDTPDIELEEGEIAEVQPVGEKLPNKPKPKRLDHPAAARRSFVELPKSPKTPLKPPSAPRAHSNTWSNAPPSSSISDTSDEHNPATSAVNPTLSKAFLPLPNANIITTSSVIQANQVDDRASVDMSVDSPQATPPPLPDSVMLPPPSTSTSSASQAEDMPNTPNSDLASTPTEIAPSLSTSRSETEVPISLSISRPPSEPRAMKNAPVGPSFTKRTLLARQKELEERIARSKLELVSAKSRQTPATDSIPVPSLDTPEDTSSSALSSKPDQTQRLTTPTVTEDDWGDVASDQATKLSQLRALVIKSQRMKMRNAEGQPNNLTEEEGPKLSDRVTPSSITTSVAVQSATPSTTSTFSLEDLAISFISETIQTAKTQVQEPLQPPQPSKMHVPVAARPAFIPRLQSYGSIDVRHELAMKQQRLEQHIAESKALMVQLTQNCSKQEKTRLLEVLREKTRTMEEANKASDIRIAQAKAQSNSNSPKWPHMAEHAGLLIISDDEDDSDYESS